MSNLRTRIIKKAIAPFFANWFRGTVAEQRARQENLAGFNYFPKGISRQPAGVGSVNAEWIRPASPDGTILYLHGGAYTLGSIKTHRMLAATLADSANMQVLLIEYRRAPEHPFPAGLEDAVSAYRWLLESGISPARTLIAGDSAGGGLALAALLRLREEGQPLPAGGILLSPWADLTLSGESVTTQAELDFILNREHLSHMAQLYARDADLRHPLVSPVFADLTGLPPLQIQVGTDEILLDDSLRIANSAEEASTPVQLEIYAEMFHVFQMFPFFKEARQAFKSIAGFARKVILAE